MLAALLLFVLAACTNDTTSEDTETEQPETTDEGTEEAGSGEISGQLEIQYFVGGYGDEWWKTVIEDFKKLILM